METLTASPHTEPPPNPRIPTFLGLPPEIRNIIYTHLFAARGDVYIAFTRDPARRSCKPVVLFQSGEKFPVALFLACRQISAEASSVFYSNNRFVLRALGGSSARMCFVDALMIFLAGVGTRARFVRHVGVEEVRACTRACHREYTGWKTALFGEDVCVVEVTKLLRVVWAGGLRFNVFCVDDGDGGTVSTDANRAVIRTLQALMSGQLGLKNYGNLVCGVAVRSDGQGGMVSWGTTPPRGISNKAWPRYYPHTTTSFTTSTTHTGDTVLELVPRPTPTLLSLPKEIRSHITNLVVFPAGEAAEIDVDTATAFPLGLPHVNKMFYASLWPTSLLAKSYVVRTCTTTTRSDFNGFRGLWRLLRKNVMYIPPDGAPVALTLKNGYPGIEKIVLEFSLEVSVGFGELGISILPLLREVKGISGDVCVAVRICCEGAVRERRVSLEKFRGENFGALEGVAEGENREVWINGLGEVVEGVVEPVDDVVGT